MRRKSAVALSMRLMMRRRSAAVAAPRRITLTASGRNAEVWADAPQVALMMRWCVDDRLPLRRRRCSDETRALCGGKIG